MNDTPQDPYRPFGEPKEPTWGTPSEGREPSPPSYTPYAAPPAPYEYQPSPHGYPPAPYGYPAPSGYGLAPHAGLHSDKSKTTAGLLQLLLPFLGVCGVGRLYAGHTTIGVLQLVLYWLSFPLMLVLIGFPMIIGIWLWTVIDGVIILSSESRDGQGRLMRS